MILLSGASGHLGRATAEAFARLGATDRVVLGSRDPSKLDDLAARGFAVRRYDFDDAAALAAAMDGIGTLVLISGDTPNDVAVAQHGRAIDAAKAAGAAVIYTSITDPGPAAIFDVARKHGGTESLLAASGLPHTLMRNGLYAENISTNLAAARESGTLALSDGRVAFALRPEMAEALARVALDPALQGKTYAITGPVAASPSEIGAALAESTGREISVERVDLVAQEAGLRAAGLPDFVVELVVSLGKAIEIGEFAEVSPDLERLLGRQPGSVLSAISAL